MAAERNYWLDTSDITGKTLIGKEEYIRKMAFCMANEFRSYVDFDGFCSIIYDFWKQKKTVHDKGLIDILRRINIQGVSLSGQEYGKLLDLLIKPSS